MTLTVTLMITRYGGYTGAMKRILAQLPISVQSYSSSPYLDLTLFSFDDKWVSVMERSNTCGDNPPLSGRLTTFLLLLTLWPPIVSFC